MKRDGRALAHNTLEEMRILAVQRMAEGEHPNDVAASFGMHRSWAYKIRAQARGRGRGGRDRGAADFGRNAFGIYPDIRRHRLNRHRRPAQAVGAALAAPRPLGDVDHAVM